MAVIVWLGSLEGYVFIVVLVALFRLAGPFCASTPPSSTLCVDLGRLVHGLETVGVSQMLYLCTWNFLGVSTCSGNHELPIVSIYK